MAFSVKIGGTVARPTINVSGEQREPANWADLSKGWGVSYGEMVETLNSWWGHRPKTVYIIEQDVVNQWGGEQSYSKYGIAPVTLVKGMSIREASRVFGLRRDTVRKMLLRTVPSGYRRKRPPRRPIPVRPTFASISHSTARQWAAFDLGASACPTIPAPSISHRCPGLTTAA